MKEVEPTATAANTKDENGNEYNSTEWELPQPVAERKDKSEKDLQYKDGQKVKVSIVSYFTSTKKEDRRILSGPFHPGGMAPVITAVEELSVGRGNVFCYVYSITPFTDEGRGDAMAVTSKIKFCDVDGDGKYELRGNGFGVITVPDWAK